MDSVVICSLMEENVSHCPLPLQVADLGGQARIDSEHRLCVSYTWVLVLPSHMAQIGLPGISISNAIFGTYLY